MHKDRCRFNPAMVVEGLALLLAGWLLAAAPASAATQTWDTPVFGGSDWVVPAGVTTATFEVFGAQGGGTGGSRGGAGGKTVATIVVTPGETLKINVGGAGPTLGWTGGSNGGNGAGSYVCADAGGGLLCLGGGGGGASDVRQGGTATANRVLVAGGGGGAGGSSTGYCSPDMPPICATSVHGGDGGDAGGLAGARGFNGANRSGAVLSGGCGGGGGTQTAGGIAGGGVLGDQCNGLTGNIGPGGEGTGGRGGDTAKGGGSGGGGGGGYFGGGGGSGGDAGSGGGGGGGGSSFAAAGASNVSIIGGVNLGNGSVTVTYGGGPVATHALSVTKSGTGSGTVTSSPAGIDCGFTCTHAYDAGTSVTLTASAASGSIFGGWSGACSGSGACTVTISADLTVTATYKTAASTQTKPTISKLLETNSVFVVGSVSTPLTGQTAAAHHKHGTVFSFSLDQPATIKITLQARAHGRRVGGKCKPATPARRRKPRCTVTITIATLTRTAHSGPNRVALTGRIDGHAFDPGHYEAVITAADSAGQSPAETLRFTIVKR
jgi:Divergent InlB B-repeat domain